MALQVNDAVMCIEIKFCKFARVFQRICLAFYATDGGYTKMASPKK